MAMTEALAERKRKTARRPPGDADIRPWVMQVLLGQYRDDPETVIIEELGLRRHRARVDIAVVNGVMHAYEIKSDRDSLRRLPGQLATYGQVFELGTLVVGPRHLNETLQMAPRWWQVLEAELEDDMLGFRCRRKGAPNPGVDPRAQVELIWLDDAMRMLEDRDGARGFRGKPRQIVWDRVCELYTDREVAAAVRAQLKARATP